MELNLNTTYILKLDTTELRIVIRALMNKLVKEEDIATARALSDKISMGKVKSAETTYAQMMRLKQIVEAKSDEGA